jgi:hypothetical protein
LGTEHTPVLSDPWQGEHGRSAVVIPLTVLRIAVVLAAGTILGMRLVLDQPGLAAIDLAGSDVVASALGMLGLS